MALARLNNEKNVWGSGVELRRFENIVFWHTFRLVRKTWKFNISGLGFCARTLCCLALYFQILIIIIIIPTRLNLEVLRRTSRLRGWPFGLPGQDGACSNACSYRRGPQR
jgi:hypothetical protein